MVLINLKGVVMNFVIVPLLFLLCGNLKRGYHKSPSREIEMKLVEDDILFWAWCVMGSDNK